MKKWITLFLLVALVALSACGTDESNGSASEGGEGEGESSSESSEMRTYETENGEEIEVPANPERIVVLSSYAGNVLKLDGNLVGVDSWSKMNPNFESELEGVEEVTADNLEKIIELDPDLIVGLASTENVDQLKEIAPTVTYTYGQLGYLEQHVEIGKLLGKEEEAQQWVDDFKADAQETGEKIKEKIGEDATVTVIENFEKELYVFGDNWARGTEILYQEMGLNMPEKVKEMALEPGFYAISPEVLPEYAGDYIVFSKNSDTDTSFEQTETYQSIPAVENGNVFEADAKKFYFNDAISLEYQLEFFKEKFLGESE
ncbi:iron-hydroxamate ABC transporter substrate-binding protein [Salimicrobium halophilum]|uniref:Iron complex transport system substrate-binding protein n=1 Tax=Salimicrobium halophilum TaxID=86666 RepID=A0A1G8TXS9_9BACI|nr:iron-hydroxamate ABC transporter substrate-binding protein [Salimicrobium halophilum]SDJ45695.1 iron complex transport system substrate-binding protein [Salimicrobium halophilum]